MTLRKALGALFVFVVIFVPAPSGGDSPPIVWSTRRIVTSVAPGLSVSVPLQFTSGTSGQDVDVFVVPEIAPFLSVQPARFDAIVSSNTYDLTLSITIPATIEVPSMFEGTLHLRQGSSTLARPLEIVLFIESAAARPVKIENIVRDAFGGAYANNQILITLRSGMGLHEAQWIASSVGGSVVGSVPSINTYQIEVPTSTIQELEALLSQVRISHGSAIEFATKHNVLALSSVSNDLSNLRSNDPRFTLAYDRIDVQGAWDFLDLIGIAPRPVVVGLIDTGIDATHPEFENIDLGSLPRRLLQDFQEGGHGTQVAGIIGANNISETQPYAFPQMNGILSGLPGSGGTFVLEIRPSISPAPFSVWASIQNAVESHSARIVNVEVQGALCDALSPDQISAGLACYSSAEEFEADKRRWFRIFARHLETLFVLPAGNYGVDVSIVTNEDDPSSTLPAGILLENTITVGATDLSDMRAIWNFLEASNHGPGVEIAAPGSNVYAPVPGDGYTDPLTTISFNGTSASAPMVAGTAALLFASDPTIDSRDDDHQRTRSLLQFGRACY